MRANITPHPIDTKALIDEIRSEKAGCIVTFEGIVRITNNKREVVSLELETYEPMAVKELQKIMSEAMNQWELSDLVITHRIGKLDVGETIVLIAVSAPHRMEAFLACQYCIDELKKRVPLWKKEIFADGEAWVERER